MFIRFIVEHVDENAQVEQGVFIASGEMRRKGLLSKAGVVQLRKICDWFNKNLESPERVSRSTKKYAHPEAICWFKETAHEHLKRIARICDFLNAHGAATRAITTDRPGYIVYEDEFQVAAVPFRQETFARGTPGGEPK